MAKTEIVPVKPKAPKVVRYNPTRHCGHPIRGPEGRQIPCTALKGQGTPEPGRGYCAEHAKPSNFYGHIKRNKLADLLERVRSTSSDPAEIVSELEVMRALAMGYLEDHADLDNPEDITQASDLMDKIIRAATAFRKMRQEQMIHLKIMELIHMEMARVVMAEVEKIDPAVVDDWRRVLSDRIRDGWGMIHVETDIRKVKALAESFTEEESTDGN